MTDFVVNIKNYVFKMLEIQAVEGMKALLMDDEATQMVALACSQTEIIMKDVVLVGKISRPRPSDENELKATAHLKAVVVLRPTRESVDILCKHLKNPQFSSYYIFFTNIIPTECLRTLAEADTGEVIRQVHEYYSDYHPITDRLLVANRPLNVPLYNNRNFWRPQDKQAFSRNTDALVSLILSQKIKPTIRFASGSPLAKLLVTDLNRRIVENEQLFHFPQQNQDAVLLILDRKDDPVTPLLQNWTYQSMVHEQLGIDANTVNLKNVPNIREELKEIVLSTHQDEFFKKSLNLNYGELSSAVKDLISQFQKKSQITTKIDSIQDMQNFMDSYPEFRQMSGNVSKHMAVMSELSRLVNCYSLLDISSLEQDIACPASGSSHTEIIEGINSFLNNPKIRFSNKLNIVLLYALRFENERNSVINQFKSKLLHTAPDVSMRARVRTIDEIVKSFGSAKRQGDLFGTGNVWSLTKTMVSSLKGFENAFTRHKPMLLNTLEQLYKGRLRNIEYPTLDTEGQDTRINKPALVYVYMLGGLTYEETSAVSTGIINNREYNGVVMMGSNTIHNSESFINDIMQDDGSEIDDQEQVSIDMFL